MIGIKQTKTVVFENGESYTDVFAHLKTKQGWEATQTLLNQSPRTEALQGKWEVITEDVKNETEFYNTVKAGRYVDGVCVKKFTDWTDGEKPKRARKIENGEAEVNETN